MDETQLVILATALSILGYNIGVLLMMAPLPFSGLKRWAPTLMKDSIFSLIMIISVYSIVELIGYFQSMLGVSWSDFRNWLLIRTGVLMTLKTTLSGVLLLSSKFLSGVVASAFFEPIIKAVNYSLTVLYTILGIGVLVKNYFIKILIIGIVLFSIPFRFARGAGSYLIAFAIVFPVGLPLLPGFVEAFSQPFETDFDVQLYQANVIDFAVFQVKNLFNKNVYGPVIKAYDTKGELLFLYKGDEHGNVFASFPDRPIPSNITYTIVLDYLGLMFYLEPYPFDPDRDLTVTQEFFPHASKKGVLNARHLIWNHPNAFALIGVTNTSIISEVLYLANGSRLIIDGSKIITNEKVYVSFEKGCKNNIGMSSGNITVRTLDDHWYGIDTRTIVFDLYPSNKTLFIEAYFSGCEYSTSSLQVEEIRYLENKGFTFFRDFTREASSILISWLILPTIYLFILLSITLGVSYVIGGIRERIPIRVF